MRLVPTEVGSESKGGCSFTDAISPRVKTFTVSYECDPDLG
ncbi:MAG: hypothetical protein OEZ06_17375 [Myxococcales bacterium]|nr:hypothetical protein [Myxococcales bacterium]